MNEVAVTGLGILTTAGAGVAANLEALRSGRSGLGPLTLFESPICGGFPVGEVAGVSEKPRIAALGKRALEEALVGVDPSRTGLAVGKTPLEVERKLLKSIPQEFMLHAHHWLILHGRYVCKARTPNCVECIVRDLCRSGRKEVF